MRAFDKLKSLVASERLSEQSETDSRAIGTLNTSDANTSEAPTDTPSIQSPAFADEKTAQIKDIPAEKVTEKSVQSKTPEPKKPEPSTSDEQIPMLLETIAPPAAITAAKIEPKPEVPKPNAPIKPIQKPEAPKPAASIKPGKATTQPSLEKIKDPKVQDTMTDIKPSEKLSADLAALDNLTTSPAEPQAIEAKPQSPLNAPAPSRELGPSRKTAGLTHMRNDLAQLNKDMSSGEQFYAQSLRRINDLIDYAYETETTLTALEKLEPENARLKDDLAEATKSLTDQIVRAESMKSKADAYETRYLETRQALEKSQLSLTQMESLRETLSREIEAKDNDLAIMINKAREIKNAHNLNIKALDDYKAKSSELANELSVTLSGRHEIEQRLQDMSARYEALQSERNTIERMVTQTRNAQKATEEHNLALKTQLETVLSDIKIFKQQFDAAAQNKDAEIALLRTKIADMASDMAVKNGVVERAHDEMAQLREKFDTAHRGRRNLLEHIESQKSETDHLKAELEKSREQHSQLTSDYVQAQTDIESLRRVNDAQSDKLKRYTALNRKPVVTPASFTVAADPFERNREPAAPRASEIAPNTEKMPAITLNTPVFATSDTPPPHPENTEDSVEAAIAALDALIDPVKTPVPEPISGAVAQDVRPDAYKDINFDFEPETDRRAPNSPMRNQDAPGTGLVAEKDFEREFAELSAMAPIQTDTPVRADASGDLKSDAQKIEDALLEFHDIDLLADSAG